LRLGQEIVVLAVLILPGHLEHGNEPVGIIKALEYLDSLSNCQFFK